MARQQWWSPFNASTRAFAREARRMPGFGVFDFVHGYVYARWPYLYIAIGTGEHRLARILGSAARLILRLFPPRSSTNDGSPGFADTYHGKVVPLEAAKQLVMVREDVTLRNLEQVIPYACARDIVLLHPDHIVALQCPCRTARAHPCQPLDVCLIIGEPFASFIAGHHPGRCRQVSQEEAVDILTAEHDRGPVHHAFFKDAMLGRFYAICNCCSCCCGAMQAWQSGVPMLCSSGYVSQVAVPKCTGCGDCATACQFRAIAVRDRVAVVDTNLCMGCGVCASKCRNGAASLRLEPAKGQPLELRALLEPRN
jgi:ferredoxin